MTIKEMSNKFKKIADFYGYEAQSRQCIEECAELIQAINKVWRVSQTYGFVDNDGKEYQSLAEGLADVQIMICQMAYLLNLDISQIMAEKINRQLERIKNG